MQALCAPTPDAAAMTMRVSTKEVPAVKEAPFWTGRGDVTPRPAARAGNDTIASPPCAPRLLVHQVYSQM